VPFSRRDRQVAAGVSREAQKFARLFRRIPVADDAPDHPAVRPMLRSFRNINRAIATRDSKGWVSLAQQARIGREFQKIGAALHILPKRRKRKSS